MSFSELPTVLKFMIVDFLAPKNYPNFGINEARFIKNDLISLSRVDKLTSEVCKERLKYFEEYESFIFALMDEFDWFFKSRKFREINLRCEDSCLYEEAKQTMNHIAGSALIHIFWAFEQHVYDQNKIDKLLELFPESIHFMELENTVFQSACLSPKVSINTIQKLINMGVDTNVPVYHGQGRFRTLSSEINGWRSEAREVEEKNRYTAILELLPKSLSIEEWAKKEKIPYKK